LGWTSYERRDYETARDALLVALNQEMPPEPKRPRMYATFYLARSAHNVGDHATAVDAFSKLPASLFDTELAGMYSISQIEMGRDAAGWIYALARYGYLKGRMQRTEVESAIAGLEQSPYQPAGTEYASALEALLADKRP
jgi:hypothetical protein